jgi:hypothetical protein
MLTRGVRNTLPTLVGKELGCAKGNSQLVSTLRPCWDVDLCNKEKAMVCTPLKSCPLLCLGKIIAQEWSTHIGFCKR